MDSFLFISCQLPQTYQTFNDPEHIFDLGVIIKQIFTEIIFKPSKDTIVWKSMFTVNASFRNGWDTVIFNKELFRAKGSELQSTFWSICWPHLSVLLSFNSVSGIWHFLCWLWGNKSPHWRDRPPTISFGVVANSKTFEKKKTKKTTEFKEDHWAQYPVW